MLQFLKNIFSKKDDSVLKKSINKDAFLVDVRTPQEFANGSVKGAVNIPLNNIESKLQRFKNKATIVVFCRSGNRSNQAKNILLQNNIPNVINGGSWQNVDKFINN
jgi:phage shock protein E